MNNDRKWDNDERSNETLMNIIKCFSRYLTMYMFCRALNEKYQNCQYESIKVENMQKCVAKTD